MRLEFSKTVLSYLLSENYLHTALISRPTTVISSECDLNLIGKCLIENIFTSSFAIFTTELTCVPFSISLFAPQSLLIGTLSIAANLETNIREHRFAIQLSESIEVLLFCAGYGSEDG